MEYKLIINIKYINNNRVIEIDIVPQVKLETVKGSTVFLALLIIFRQVFKCLLIDIMTSPFKHVL